MQRSGRWGWWVDGEGKQPSRAPCCVPVPSSLGSTCCCCPSRPHLPQVRRAADPAKSLVRQFLTRWKGNGLVEGEESYRQLSAAIQLLGTFYQQNGQRTRLTGEVGQAVLDRLDAAEAALPMREDKVLPLPFF